MKKIISVVLTLTLLAGILMLSGCSLKTEKLDTAALLGNYNIEELKGTEINVYNWGEYISDGEGGSVDVISEFEKLTGIKVNYNMYDSNEDLYAKLKSGGVNYDVIIPSDYMAERLKNEGLLQKLDYSVITNYEGIGDEYKNLFFDENNEYTVAYTGGMVGLIYNTTMVSEKPDSWSAMWDPKYSGEILTFNNSRDAFGVAQYLLGYDVNSTNPDEWRAAEEKLKEQKPLIQSYVMDEVFNKIATLTGGRAAEELIFHSITTGASNDIEQATKLARAMVTRYGMNDQFGMVALETVNNQYLGGDTSLACSPETARVVDEEVIKLVKEAYKKAMEILAQNEGKLHEIAAYLLEKETITGDEFMQILNAQEPTQE